MKIKRSKLFDPWEKTKCPKQSRGGEADGATIANKLDKSSPKTLITDFFPDRSNK